MRASLRFILLFLGTTAVLGATANSAKPTKVVFLGDSITAGYGVEKEQAFPALLAELLLKKDLKIEAVNAGISGSTSASGPGRMKWLLRSKPDLILLELGANDALRGQKLEMTKDNLKQTIQLARDQGVIVVLVGMRIPKNYGKDYGDQFNQIFSDLAREEGVYLIPFIEKFLSDKTLVQSDAIHPNAKGHEVIAQEILPHLVTILKGIDMPSTPSATKTPSKG